MERWSGARIDREMKALGLNHNQLCALTHASGSPCKVAQSTLSRFVAGTDKAYQASLTLALKNEIARRKKADAARWKVTPRKKRK
jgi:hypothetical protein